MMDGLSEVLVVSALGCENLNCSIYDTKNGNVLKTFKDGSSVRNGLAFIAEDYIISAFKDQCMMKIWTLSQTHPEDCPIIVPSPVSCLAVTSCGMYCVAGIEKSIYLWETSKGILITCLQYHSQAVTCLRMSCDGSHFISGGKDGMVLVWLLSEAVAENEISDNIRPRFTWNDHAAEVTDIHVGNLSFYARVATASKDMTCRIYELETGILLTTVRVDYAITAVTMDESEYFLFLGSAEGEIYRINLFAEKEADVHYNKSDLKCSFIGHTKAITCLSISSSGKYLVSGSEDHDCRLWDLTNFTIVRKVSYNGPVTNAFITLMPPGLVDDNKFVPRFLVSSFKRDFNPNVHALDTVVTRVQEKELSLFHIGSPDEIFDPKVLNNSAECRDAVSRGNVSVENLSRINNQIYAFALRDTIQEVEVHSESSED